MFGLYGEGQMEPVSNLKRPVKDLLMCIICQAQKKETLVNAGPKGLQTLQDSTTKRHKLKDQKNKDAIDRIFNFTASESPTWHKSCYCAFTDKDKISRLEASGSKPNTEIVILVALVLQNYGVHLINLIETCFYYVKFLPKKTSILYVLSA